MDSRSQQYLDRFLASLQPEHRQQYTSFSADYFCADEVNANLCADLVRRGIKVATCSLKQSYLAEQEPLPAMGHLQVVTDWAGQPVAIIEITSVTESRYCDVDEAFAHAEGEGDRTLAWWRQAHWTFFSAECQRMGIEPSEEMILVLERFKVVYPA